MSPLVLLTQATIFGWLSSLPPLPACAYSGRVMSLRTSDSKVMSRSAMVAERARLKREGRVLVFTNGAFDILHAGHVTYLQFARQQGDALVVGLNSDASVKRYKGDKRPVNPQSDRALVLAALECVDYVVVFDEDEPKELIGELIPDVLVKGADWAHYVSGRDVVEAHGGKVVLADMVAGRSTTNVIGKIVEVYGDGASQSASVSAAASKSSNTEPLYFGHEKLDCYRLGQEFVAWSAALIVSHGALSRELRNQLERASLSIVLNIAEGNEKRERAVRARYFDDARESANECAACLDAAVSIGGVPTNAAAPGKVMLARLTAMLTGLISKFSRPDSMREDSAGYGAPCETETETDGKGAA